ncbi:MAG: hypothetical protein ACRDRA_17630, partial [Pseudonocardiaceae bacterium]
HHFALVPTAPTSPLSRRKETDPDAKFTATPRGSKAPAPAAGGSPVTALLTQPAPIDQLSLIADLFGR